MASLKYKKVSLDKIEYALHILCNGYNWLKIKKLSLNVQKTKMMIFHKYQRKVKAPKLKICESEITCSIF